MKGCMFVSVRMVGVSSPIEPYGGAPLAPGSPINFIAPSI